MSKYTTQVRFICEEAAGLSESVGYNSIDSIIEKAAPKIFDFAFPIYDESYRTILEEKILRHYYVMEIGCETVGLWKHFLKMKLNEIMPYYNKMYESTLFEYNPLHDVDYTKVGSRTADGTKKSEGTSTDSQTTESEGSSTASAVSGTKDLFSDTPQGAVSDLEGERYLTEARTVRNDTSTENSNEAKTGSERTGSDSRNDILHNVDEYTERIFGKTGNVDYSKNIMNFREAIINVDMMIIDELASLFFQLW